MILNFIPQMSPMPWLFLASMFIFSLLISWIKMYYF